MRYLDGLEGAIEFETLREYRRCARIVCDAFPDATLENLARPQVRDWAARKRLSKKRLDNLLIPIRGTYKQANDDGITEHNPVQGFQIRRVSQPKEQIDPFTPEEIQALDGTPLGHLWNFWAWTGLRSGELIGLQWGDVDDSGRTIHVRRAVRVGREKRPKTASGKRQIVLLPAAARSLSCVGGGNSHRPEEPVFCNPNTGDHWYEDRALARAFRKACEASGVRYRYPYQLRHTFATWALSSGENPRWIATYMGHRDVMMLFRVYGKWMPSMDPKAGSRMAQSAKIKAA